MLLRLGAPPERVGRQRVRGLLPWAEPARGSVVDARREWRQRCSNLRQQHQRQPLRASLAVREPLERTRGECASHVMAFARRSKNQHDVGQHNTCVVGLSFANPHFN